MNLDRYWPTASVGGASSFDVVDVFSGCGGMSLGFAAANAISPLFRLAGALDLDPVANRTYEANLKIKVGHEDVSTLLGRSGGLSALEKTWRLRSAKPLILIGCAPCQGFSSHRNEGGSTDRRNSLFSEFSKIAVRLNPAAIVIENVPELLTDRYWPLVRKARTLLERSGYWVNLSVHNMAEFGVPQERFRALLVAMKRPFQPLRGFLNRKDFRTVRHAIEWLPAINAGEKDPADSMHYTAGHRESTLETIRAVPRDGGSRPKWVGPLCLQRAAERNGRAVYEDVYGRLFWDRPAVTVTAFARNPASGRYVHPEQDRGLSVREAALLQGFPKQFVLEGSLDERFRQIGNAVPPPFAAALALHLVGELASASTNVKFDLGIVDPVGPSFSRLIPALKAGHRTTTSLARNTA